jgi:N-acetylmuramoyl-L-alanine amidase CwlA
MEIIQRLIPKNLTDTRPGLKLVPEFLTIHETDNTASGANAEAHARLQENGNSRQASWHLQVDDLKCIQSIPFNEIAWAAGDGANGPGNRKSIHLEICVNSDGNYKKAVQNAAIVAAQVMKQFNIPIANLVQHNHWSGKNCPSIMRSGKKGIIWSIFVEWVKQNLNPVVEPKKTEVVEDMENAIVIGGYPDIPMAELVALKVKAPIYFRNALPSGKIAKTVYVVGGSVDGIQADKVVNLTGSDRIAVANAVGKFIG